MEKKIIKISQIPSDADMSRYFSKEFFNDFEFVINDPNCTACDYWFVFNDLPFKSETAYVSPNNIFFIAGEIEGGNNHKFLQQFQKVITVDPRLRGNNILYYHLGLPWFVNQSFDNLYYTKEIHKSKLISIVASNKSFITYSRNYKVRYDFIMSLKKYFGDNIDIFGRGFQQFKDKDEVLLPYKFTVALENICLPYNITEKLYDCYLTHTFPFYYDCNNLNRFIDDDAYIKLDITDHKYSIDLIEKILNTPGFYESRLNALIEAKKQFLLEYSYVGNMVNIAKNFGCENAEKQKITLKSDNALKSKIKLHLINLVYNTIK